MCSPSRSALITGMYQTTIGARALKNLKGGVQTNADGCVQIEVVGYPGITMPTAMAIRSSAGIVALMRNAAG